MRKSKESVPTRCVFIVKLSDDDAASIILLFKDKSKDEFASDHLRGMKAQKATIEIEGLDDGFFKQYEVYTQIIIDTTSEDDTILQSGKEIPGKKKKVLTTSNSIEEAFLQNEFQARIDFPGSDFGGAMRFDDIFFNVDSGFFEVKVVNRATIVASFDLKGSDEDEKRYRIRGENIRATPRGYIIKKQNGKQSSC